MGAPSTTPNTTFSLGFLQYFHNFRRLVGECYYVYSVVLFKLVPELGMKLVSEVV